MPRFHYVGYTRDGSRRRGLIEAPSASEATQRLKADGVRVLQLGLSAERAERRPVRLPPFLERRVDLQRFFYDLALLMEAGLGLDRALKAIAEETGNGGNQALAAESLARLSNGMSPSEAFARMEEDSPGISALILSAEHTGKLHVVCAVIAADLDMRRNRRSQMLEALTYPAFLLLLTFAALAVVTIFLVPAVLPVFEGANARPPPLIRVLDAIGTAMRTWALPAALVVAFLLLFTFRKSGRQRLRSFATRLVLVTPMIGDLVRKQGLARYMRSLALLLGNGVAMQKALVLSAKVCPIPSYRAVLEALRERVVGGERLSEALLEARIFPRSVSSLVAIGDEVNSLPRVLERSASLLEEEAMRMQKTMLGLMTPCITIFMGLLIGALVVSVMSALLSINQMSTI
ncbi:type II secretion system F family protein [Agrobacterium pusense]|uniref:type II secretion system F family protein n=1 Tax=Agrobacterium pusense TaxID=648995 RepID=UPI002FDC8603